MNNSVLVVAGESSGDNLASSIVSEWIKSAASKIDFWGCGGSKMQAIGIDILYDVEDLAVIGFIEGLANYMRLKKILNRLVKEAKKRKITAAVLVDYPGFNLRLAQKLHHLKIPVYLVVSPQIWAWRYKRVETIKKYIKAVFCLYQFELGIYQKEGIRAYFMGHPMAFKIKDFLKENSGVIKKERQKIKQRIKIALLPGSRRSEVENHMPFLIQVAVKFHQKFPQTIFEIPTASPEMSEWLNAYELPSCISVQNETTYLTLATATAGIICSGTATLECALFNVPFLLIYKTSQITYEIGKRVIRLPYIGLVNIIANRFVTKEFIQDDMDEKAVLEELEKLTLNAKERKKTFASFKEILKSVETPNPAALCAKILKADLSGKSGKSKQKVTRQPKAKSQLKSKKPKARLKKP